MACGRVFTYSFTILFLLGVTFAQDSATGSSVNSDITTSAAEAEATSLPPAHENSGSSGLFDHFSSNFPFFQFSQLPFFGGFRHKRSTAPEHENENEAELHDRFFFSLLTRRIIPCNYGTEGGSRCTACKVLQRCYPGNIGTVRTCTGLFPYCNNGRCSMSQGELCSATTSTSSTSTSTSTSTSSTSSSTSSSTTSTTTKKP